MTLSRRLDVPGLPLTDNIFDGEMNGLTHAVNSIYKGVRSGSYLFVKGKPNITILSEVRSKRLIIDYATRTAKGVTIIDGLGNEHDFHATREVILSQGVFESPKLLMLSGIGPARELAKHGIPVIVDSRHVGQHLLDHPGVPFVLRIKEGYALDSTLLRDGPKKDAAIAAYQKDHSGPLGSGFLEMIGFPASTPTYRRTQFIGRPRLPMVESTPSRPRDSRTSNSILSPHSEVHSSGSTPPHRRATTSPSWLTSSARPTRAGT